VDRGVGCGLAEFRRLLGVHGLSKGVSFASLTGMTRSAGGLCCRGGRFGYCISDEDGVTTAVVIVEGDSDSGVINRPSSGEVAILESISGVVGGVLGFRVFRGGEVGGVLEFVERLRGNISAEGSVWLCVGAKMVSMIGN
jgi:hypothetical protein